MTTRANKKQTSIEAKFFGMIVLAWGSGVLVLIGIAITALGLFSPHLLHLH